MEEKLRIKLHLYETDLMVNVPREEEQYYRAAAKLIAKLTQEIEEVMPDKV